MITCSGPRQRTSGHRTDTNQPPARSGLGKSWFDRLVRSAFPSLRASLSLPSTLATGSAVHSIFFLVAWSLCSCLVMPRASRSSVPVPQPQQEGGSATVAAQPSPGSLPSAEELAAMSRAQLPLSLVPSRFPTGGTRKRFATGSSPFVPARTTLRLRLRLESPPLVPRQTFRPSFSVSSRIFNSQSRPCGPRQGQPSPRRACLPQHRRQPYRTTPRRGVCRTGPRRLHQPPRPSHLPSRRLRLRSNHLPSLCYSRCCLRLLRSRGTPLRSPAYRARSRRRQPQVRGFILMYPYAGASCPTICWIRYATRSIRSWPSGLGRQ